MTSVSTLTISPPYRVDVQTQRQREIVDINSSRRTHHTQSWTAKKDISAAFLLHVLPYILNIIPVIPHI